MYKMECFHQEVVTSSDALAGVLVRIGLWKLCRTVSPVFMHSLCCFCCPVVASFVLWLRGLIVPGSQVSSRFPGVHFFIPLALSRFLRLWSCRLLCHLFHCMTNRLSAHSPVQRLPPLLLSHAPPPPHSTGSTRLHRLPRLTRAPYPPTVSHVCTYNIY